MMKRKAAVRGLHRHVEHDKDFTVRGGKDTGPGENYAFGSVK